MCLSFSLGILDCVDGCFLCIDWIGVAMVSGCLKVIVLDQVFLLLLCLKVCFVTCFAVMVFQAALMLMSGNGVVILEWLGFACFGADGENFVACVGNQYFMLPLGG